MLICLLKNFLPTNYPGLENLQASPCIRFNKEGILLAVSTNDNGVKILANADGIRMLRTVENRTFDASRVASAAAVKVLFFSQTWQMFKLYFLIASLYRSPQYPLLDLQM
jgi:hypothetical protein